MGDAPALRLVFLGTPPFAARCLEALLESRHAVVGVFTRPDRPSGRGWKQRQSAVKQLALEHHLPLLQPASFKEPEALDRLASLAADLGVVAAYGRILPAAALAQTPYGFINAHASLLPALRGAAPIERAILEGYEETGVTIIQMNERMDAGEIIGQRSIPIDPQSDGGSLREVLAALAADMLIEAVDAIAAGTATYTPQDEALATYAPPIDKREAAIDWSVEAEALARRVRAFCPAPAAFAYDGGRRLKILAADVAADAATGAEPGTVVSNGPDGFVIACGHGALRILKVQPEGKRAMPAADYLRGRKGPALERLDAGGD